MATLEGTNNNTAIQDLQRLMDEAFAMQRAMTEIEIKQRKRMEPEKKKESEFNRLGR
jgi:hypothetical protein